MMESIVLEKSNSSVKTRCLMYVRSQCSQNQEIKELLSKTDKFILVKDEVVKILGNDISFGSNQILEDSVEVILDEFDRIRQEGEKQYIIDSESGLLVKSMEEGDVFVPPPYIDENGKVHKSIPQLHPRISTALILDKVKKYRFQKREEKINKPEYRLTFAHARDPQEIVKRTKQLLESRGKVIEKTRENRTKIEFGKEHIEAEDQSINPRFHRTSNYSSILASKILYMMTSNDICWISDLKREQNSNHMWYSVDVYFKKRLQLE